LPLDERRFGVGVELARRILRREEAGADQEFLEFRHVRAAAADAERALEDVGRSGLRQTRSGDGDRRRYDVRLRDEIREDHQALLILLLHVIPFAVAGDEVQVSSFVG